MDSVKRSGIQGQRPFIYSFQIALKAELSQETRKADILKKKSGYNDQNGLYFKPQN